MWTFDEDRDLDSRVERERQRVDDAIKGDNGIDLENVVFVQWTASILLLNN